MPLYEFRCTKCEEITEEIIAFDKIIEGMIIPCSKCKSDAKKKLSSFNFVVIGGTPRNLTSQLYKDELDTNIDEVQRKRTANTRDRVVGTKSGVVPPKSKKHIKGL